jgi:hypothetical protein
MFVILNSFLNFNSHPILNWSFYLLLVNKLRWQKILRVHSIVDMRNGVIFKNICWLWSISLIFKSLSMICINAKCASYRPWAACWVTSFLIRSTVTRLDIDVNNVLTGLLVLQKFFKSRVGVLHDLFQLGSYGIISLLLMSLLSKHI